MKCGCLTGAIASLAQLLGESAAATSCAAVDDAAAAAGAWIRTFVDCCAVERYCFDSGVDPSGAW
jgi:hypothetical protein